MARARAARPRAPPLVDPPRYARHRPEETLLYQPSIWEISPRSSGVIVRVLVRMPPIW